MSFRPSTLGFRRAFTLIELLVVVAVVSLLIALLLPAVQAAREAARRTSCKNNLKQIALGLHNYHEGFNSFPIGGHKQTTGFGVSWWVGLLPYLDQANIYTSFDMNSPNNAYVPINVTNANLVNNVRIPVMNCPSSILPDMNRPTVTSVFVGLPSYTGISGATNDNGFPETRVNTCCTGTGGQISAGGMLFPNATVKVRDVTDGMSCTLIVGEASDFLYDAAGVGRPASPGYPNGWLLGTSGAGTPGLPAPNGFSTNVPCYNVTTIKYGPGPILFNSTGITFAGTFLNSGPNNPLISRHGNGTHVAACDGSVHYISNSIDLTTLKQLATRDDGQLIGEY